MFEVTSQSAAFGTKWDNSNARDSERKRVRRSILISHPKFTFNSLRYIPKKWMVYWIQNHILVVCAYACAQAVHFVNTRAVTVMSSVAATKDEPHRMNMMFRPFWLAILSGLVDELKVWYCEFFCWTLGWWIGQLEDWCLVSVFKGHTWWAPVLRLVDACSTFFPHTLCHSRWVVSWWLVDVWCLTPFTPGTKKPVDPWCWIHWSW